MADTDIDGMPGGWGVTYGLDPQDALDAALDKDLDGRTNLEEFLAGTDSTDGGFTFFVSIETVPGSGVFDGLIMLNF